ncbi:hypothetical protein P167DRAFT_363158 [Morchella conica CCBAS932]|uniref:Uncharacterized protein n=1 Tax=Morchella conica CCBAS932 TaxID=1392247 RepID=A0A3N4KFN1_9PEZI|nr:hypothetical protein P167DRAFT_363158 [Morchella conica CCBAS932]
MWLCVSSRFLGKLDSRKVAVRSCNPGTWGTYSTLRYGANGRISGNKRLVALCCERNTESGTQSRSDSHAYHRYLTVCIVFAATQINRAEARPAILYAVPLVFFSLTFLSSNLSMMGATHNSGRSNWYGQIRLRTLLPQGVEPCLSPDCE